MFNIIYRLLQSLWLVPTQSSVNSYQQYAWLTKSVGDVVLALSVIGLVASILISYPYSEYFSSGVQISSHIGNLLFATSLKIGYVMRLIGHYELGLKTT